MQEDFQAAEGGSSFESSLNEAVETLRRTMLSEHERIMARGASRRGEVPPQHGRKVDDPTQTAPAREGSVPECDDKVGQVLGPSDADVGVGAAAGSSVHANDEPGGVGEVRTPGSLDSTKSSARLAEEPSRLDEVLIADDMESPDTDLAAKGMERKTSPIDVLKLHKGLTNFNTSDAVAGAKLAHREHRYELGIAVLILSNAIWMHVEIEVAMDSTVSHVVSAAFCVLFIGDLMWRLCREGRQFFLGRRVGWNWLDLFIVTVMTMEVVGRLIAVQNRVVRHLVTLRILRLTRLLRLVGFLKDLQAYHVIRILFLSIMRALPFLLWVMFFSVCIVYVLALGLAQAASSLCATGHAEHEDLCQMFGSVPRACISLYLVMYDGIPWGKILASIEDLGTAAQALFILQTSFLKIIFVNMVFASLLGIWQQVSSSEQQAVLDTAVEERSAMMAELADLFLAIDVNNSGAISLDELEMAFENPKIEPILMQMKINVIDVQTLFNTLDEDGEGAVDINEFITGMQWLRGDARVLDVVLVQKKCDKILRRLENGGPTSHRVAGHLGPTEARSQLLPARPGGGDVHRGGRGLQSMFARRQASMHKPEMRAMTLQELRQVRERIDDLCMSEQWVDMFTDKALSPETVNLYHFVQNYVAPKTAPAGLVLHFAECPAGKVGAKVLQYDAENRCRGVGELLQQTQDGIRVQLLRGNFSCGMPRLLVDDVDFGQPTRIEAPISISYKELISTTPTRPTWFCSHWWGECVVDFVTSCGEHARLRGLDDTVASYWVCGYANRQHSLAQEIGGDLEQTTFRKAMKAAEGVLLHLDNDAVALTRIWCDFEIFCTVNDGSKDFDIVTSRGGVPQLLTSRSIPKESARHKTLREAAFPISLLVKGMSTKLQDGEASNQDDHDAILDYISHHGPGGADVEENLRCVNSSLQAVFAKSAWPQAVKRGMVNDFDSDNPGALRLPDVLRADTQRRQLEMSLEHTDNLTDTEVKNIAEALPPNLSELALSFEGCRNVSNLGLEALASQLQHQPSIRKLNLDFLGCYNIGDRGLAALATRLPGQLQELGLHFDRCNAISTEGVVALAQHMPRCVKTFRGTFKGTGVDRNFSSLREIRSFTKNN